MVTDAIEAPDTVPEGYRWIAEAWRLDVAPHGASACRQVRAALHDGRIAAIVRTPFADRHPIVPAIWMETPADQPDQRILTGWLRMTRPTGWCPWIEGWVFVPEGSFRDVLRDARAG